MKKFLIILVLIAGGYHLWNKHEQNNLFSSSASPNGFVNVIMPSGMKMNTVYILAPANCPKEAGQRADALQRRLTELGIPNERSSRGSVNAPDSSDEAQKMFQRTVAVLKGEIPQVFINGMGKSNPYIDDVVAEYERTK